MSADFYRDYEPLPAASAMARGPLLVLAPHPDDEVIGCGGLILAHRRSGHPVTVAFMTDGGRGEPGSEGGEDYQRLRKGEAARAAARLGGLTLRHFDHPDGRLKDAAGVEEELGLLLDEVRPRTLSLPSPYEIHADHRATSLFGLRAAARRSESLEVLCYEIGAMMPSNLLLEVTDLFDAKIEALREYGSQLRHHDLEGKLRALNRARTVNVDQRAVLFAEGYLRVEQASVDAFLADVQRILALTESMRPRFG